MRGQNACNSRPGGGGGAQISTGGSITVRGEIRAGGGGGAGGIGGPGDCLGGAGGGSAGAVLLEAPSVEVPGQVSANGGASAVPSRTWFARSAVGHREGLAAPVRVGGGGGGGAAGRVRVNTDGGCLCNGTFSPPPTFGSVNC